MTEIQLPRAGQTYLRNKNLPQSLRISHQHSLAEPNHISDKTLIPDRLDPVPHRPASSLAENALRLAGEKGIVVRSRQVAQWTEELRIDDDCPGDFGDERGEEQEDWRRYWAERVCWRISSQDDRGGSGEEK